MRGRGWHNESQRHRLARMGYGTSGKLKDGKELILDVYHGTPIDDLSVSELRAGTGGEFQRIAGIYFTKDYNDALQYSRIGGVPNPERVLKARIVLKNPANREVLDELGYSLNGIEMRNELMDRGYDGVIDELMGEIIVFYPEQIIGG